MSITRVNAAVDTAYQIVTRFWPPSATPRDSSSKPVLTMTVYARRDRTRWELVNALSFKTSRWVRESRGRIAYRVAPSLRFDESTALRAATFVDSLAAAFELPPPDTIEYFVAASVDKALEVIGVVMPQRFGAAGGFAKPVNNQVFSGIPALGENYRHELAHVVLLPVIRGSSTSLLASEGVSTWLGGTAGGDYHESVRRLAERLAAQPHLDLDVIVSDVRVSSDIRNATGAVLAEMVHESGGVGAVSEYLRMPGSPHAMRAGLESILHRPWPTIVTEWRRYVSRIAAH